MSNTQISENTSSGDHIYTVITHDGKSLRRERYVDNRYVDFSTGLPLVKFRHFIDNKEVLFWDYNIKEQKLDVIE